MLLCIRSSHLLGKVALLVCGLALQSSDAFAARPKTAKPSKAQQEIQAPVQPATPSAKADELYRRGGNLLANGDTAGAIQALTAAEALGSGEAMVGLGKIYAIGMGGTAKDEAEAERHLKRAVAAEFTEGYAALAVLYQQRDGQGDKTRAENLLYEGITKGHTKPFKNSYGDTFSLYYYIATFAFQQGSRHYSDAAKWATQGADAGDPASMVFLSQLLEHGNGIEKDSDQAIVWAQKASDLGSQGGKLRLENLRTEQPGPVPVSQDLSALSAKTLNEQADAAYKAEDFTRAMRLYREAATRNEPEATSAIYQLAWGYIQERGMPQDYTEAEKLFKKYIAAGQDGYGSLAFLYQRMHPGIVGNELARDILLEGIAKGHLDLYSDLGELDATLMKYEEAKNWYWKGIAAKDGGSMAALSKLYRDGKGVPKNASRALYWARRAEEVGEYYGTLLIRDFTQDGVTVEDAPSEAELAADTAKAADAVADTLNKVPQPIQVPPPTFTEATPLAATKPAPAEGQAQQSPALSSPLSNVFELLNRLPQPSAVPPPEITKVEPETPAATPDPSRPASPAEILRTASEKQRADAKLLLETGLKAYRNGHFTRAFRLFRDAARKGNDQAQYEAAEMLIEGQGVERDRALGKQWLMLSAMQGNADAKQLQARLNAEDAARSKETAGSPGPAEPVPHIASGDPVIVNPVTVPPVVDLKPVPIPITQKRVALVIGNSSYPAGASLTNPRNDADDLGSALRKVGFDVISGTDLTQRGFADTMAQFADKAESAEVALVYYAGHAMQLDGENFLLPVDVRADSALNVRLTSLSLQTVIGEVETRVRTTLVLLDACRNNPIEENLKAKLRQSKRAFAETRGLARVSVSSPDTLVVFATQPNETAADGKGRNSPFAEALLENIAGSRR